uniref:Major facilitator superfamily (MFS) profile domain-containing protein n=1 Tax=Acrobeloides nanus TaxID=290746 RepID=A0A914CUD9_9BILA
MKVQKTFAKSLKLAISKTKRPPIIVPEDYPTAWKSIYIVTVVAIMSTFTSKCILPMVYPYMTQLVPDSTQETYGYIISIGNACGAFSGIIAGFLSNRFSSTTGALIFSKVIAIAAGIVYFFIGSFSTGKLVAFFVSVGLFGISSGAQTQYKTHIAMASRDFDRAKAMGWAALASTAGLILGPLPTVGGSQEVLTNNLVEEPNEKISFDKLPAIICMIANLVVNFVNLVIGT